MSAKYLITNDETLGFTGKPKSLNKNCVKKKDYGRFTSVIIPNSVKTIKTKAFYECYALASVHIPNSVEAICFVAFKHCSALASVHIPNSVSSIWAGAFEECSALASIHAPNSISTIKESTFKNCSSLASVHIPPSVSNIGERAFTKCPRLHTTFLPTNAKINLGRDSRSFQQQTLLLRPRLNPVWSLQNKSTCRASKSSYSIYL